MVTVAVTLVPIGRPGTPMVPVLAVAQLATRGRDVVIYVFVIARNRRVVVVLPMVPVVAAVVVPRAMMVTVFVVVPILVVVVIAILSIPVGRLLVGIINIPPGSLLLVAIDMTMLRRLRELLRDIRSVLQGQFAQLLRGR